MFHSPGAIALHVGPIAIRWYGVLMASAMALGLWLGHRDARRRGIDPESLLKAAELALLGGLVYSGAGVTALALAAAGLAAIPALWLAARPKPVPLPAVD